MQNQGKIKKTEIRNSFAHLELRDSEKKTDKKENEIFISSSLPSGVKVNN